MGDAIAQVQHDITGIRDQLTQDPYNIAGLPDVNAIQANNLDPKILELNQTITTHIEDLEKLTATIDSRLRQISPDHAIRDLVRLVGENNPDAMDFSLLVLQTPPPPEGLLEKTKELSKLTQIPAGDRTPEQIARLAALPNEIAPLRAQFEAQVSHTDPALLAELFRKNMGLAFG